MGDRLLCSLCDRQPGSQRPFFCAKCACAAVYEARFKSAQTLLQREAHGRNIERTVRDGAVAVSTKASAISSSGRSTDIGLDPEGGDEAASARRLAYDRLRSERARVKLRTRAVEQGNQETETECQTLRNDIARRREEMRVRRELLQSGTSDLDKLTARLEAVSISTAKISSRTDPLQRKTADARTYMIREAANLWGLGMKRKKGRDGKTREMAYIAGLPVNDLRDLLSAKPEQLNASLLAIVYLLNQTCSYLGLKLPSQLLLPDKSHAWPRILPVHSSYSEQAILVSQVSKTNTDQGSRSMIAEGVDGSSSSETQARARPLHLRQPLMKLFAEDTRAYESFAEAVSLLAFDIAWLAKTQGMEVCYRRNVWSWEGACDLGRNLWLLFGPSQRKIEHATAKNSANDENDDEPLVKIGVFSHSTNKNNVAGPDAGMLGMREWKLANPSSLIRKVKEALADRKMAGEWELLEEEEWDTGAMGTTRQEVDHQQGGKDRPTKGWQKLRPRNQEEGAPS